MNLEKRYFTITKENYEEVAKKLEELGITWGGHGFTHNGKSIKPTQYNPFINGTLDVKEILVALESKRMTINHVELETLYMDSGYVRLEVETLLKPSTPAFKLVSKLEDLDGLENGNGMCLSWDEKDRVLEVKCNGKLFCYWHKNESIEVWLGILKAMGFEFEMKTKRTEEEIIAEIEKLAKIGEDNRHYIYFGEDVNKYMFWTFTVGYKISFPERKGLTREDAERLCKELNSL